MAPKPARKGMKKTSPKAKARKAKAGKAKASKAAQRKAAPRRVQPAVRKVRKARTARPPPRPEVQGHRGCGDLAPENSVQAMRRAGDLGLDSVEFDVRRTCDGVLHVTHGPEYGPSRIELMSSAELTKNGAPTLVQVIRACAAAGAKRKRTLAMNVELKTAEPSVVKAVVESIRGIPGVRVSSFQFAALQRVEQLAPEIPLGWLLGAASRPVDEHDPSQGMVRAPVPVAALAKCARKGSAPVEGDSVNLCVEVLTKELCDAVHARGQRVMAWFPGMPKPAFHEADGKAYARVAKLGADVICANRPDLLVGNRT